MRATQLADISPASESGARHPPADSMRRADEAILRCYSQQGRRVEPHRLDSLLVEMAQLIACQRPFGR